MKVAGPPSRKKIIPGMVILNGPMETPGMENFAGGLTEEREQRMTQFRNTLTSHGDPRSGRSFLVDERRMVESSPQFRKNTSFQPDMGERKNGVVDPDARYRPSREPEKKRAQYYQRNSGEKGLLADKSKKRGRGCRSRASTRTLPVTECRDRGDWDRRTDNQDLLFRRCLALALPAKNALQIAIRMEDTRSREMPSEKSLSS